MTEFANPTPEIPRDRYGRPQIILPDGKRSYYTRCTTFVGAYEDTYNLEQWKMRQAAIGLSLRPDLQIAVHAHKDDKTRLNAICQEALDAAGSSAGATTGTALHALTEAIDRGQGIPAGLPLESERDLQAYAAATADFKSIHIEQMMVHDEFKVAGTPDRVVEYRGERYIADLKTGNVDFGAGKIAAQLAMYARSKVYNLSAERGEHGASLLKGLVIHLPAGTGTCEVKWIDLHAGWEIAKVCKQVREMRSLKATQLYTPLAGKTDRTLHQVLAGPPVDLKAAIAAADTPAAVRALWTANFDQWTDEHTEIAKARVAELEQAS